ncbi:MAG: GTP-binding protein [Ignavibacteriota bacterium]
MGGFLGAGKTTLILTAARLLQQRGLRASVILNDQGGDLVDTHYASAMGVDCDQVTGGCFCCRFPDLVDAANRLLEFQPDVIFAEAVGSCTDIVATTLRPLTREYRDRFTVAPLTVVLHPQASFDNSDLDFLYRNQVAEADILFARGGKRASLARQAALRGCSGRRQDARYRLSTLRRGRGGRLPG